MESKGKIIILFIANCLFVLAAVGLAIFANINWGKDKMQDYDMGGVVFDDLTVEYDGQPHSVSATNLPEGVSVSYDNNDRTEIGTYTVTAHFYGDEVRYNPIPDKTATLTITKPAKSRILSATGFEIDETGEPPRIYCDVPNTTESIDLSDKITVMPHRTWKLYQDLNGDNELISKSMSLELGHNKAYIIITDLINNTAEYEVDVYRLDMKSYVFKYEGQVHASGRIQEKSQLAKPETPEKPYYTFTGWAVEGSTDIVEFPYTVTEDITFVAQYVPANYKITYHLNGGTNDENNPLYYNIESPDITLLPATRAGYVFDGWYADSEFGTQVTVIEHGSHGGKQLYAKWTAVDYKINYYLNGGQNDGRNPDHYNAEMPDILLLPATRDYYDFMGWYTDGQFGTQVTVIERGSYGEKNLYAKWTPTEYQITYFLYGGENNEGNPASYNIETPEITLLPATRAGYAFDGWYADSEFGTQITVIEHGSHGGKQLYAKWIYGSEGLIYEQAGSEFKVVGYNGNAREVAVPDVWKGLPVTAIEKGVFENCTNLEKLTLPFVGAAKEGEGNTHFGYIFGADTYENNSTAVPSSLKTVIITGGSTIGEMAFSRCAGLESVEIPAGITQIGILAFGGCKSLKSIEIPASVTQIGGGAFSACSSLESVTFGENIQLNAIAQITFSYCESLKSIDIPDSVTQIDTAAFERCKRLTEIEIPASVTSIATFAFYACGNLKKAAFAEGSKLTFIGSEAFAHCTSLTGIIIPSSVTQIDNEAFCFCEKLESIAFGENSELTQIGERAFYFCAFANITLPKSVTAIGNSAFGYCYKLTNIRIEENSRLSSIGFGAFWGCTSLKEITLPFVGETKDGKTNSHFGYIFRADTYEENSTCVPSSLKTVIITGGSTIDYDAFSGCASIESITLPDSLTEINPKAFMYCSSLKHITIPDGVPSLYYGTFSGCTSLKSIEIPKSLISISGNLFRSCTSLNAVYITDIASWCDIFFFDVESNPLYIAKNLYLNNTLVTTLEIPSSVTSIGLYAFYNCINLKSVTFGRNSEATFIGSSAFYGCTSLSSIMLPENLTSIGSNAFYNTAFYNNKNNWVNKVLYLDNYLIEAKTDISGSYSVNSGTTLIAGHAFDECENLESIKIPYGVTFIGSYAFYGCTSLSSVDIPSGVATIGGYAFYDCTSLLSIDIPSSVTSIGNSAFYNCTSLEIVTFGENSQLTSINVGMFYKCTNLKSIEIPDSVTHIGNAAFRFCENLKSVTLGENSKLTYIGAAFRGCTSLESIVIPAGVNYIHCAFADCENLKSVIFKNTSGWSVVRGVNTDSVSSSDLTNPSTAAEYLKGTYSDCDWRRAEDAESN